MEVVPESSPFTLADVVQRLSSETTMASVRTTIDRLIKRGEVNRVRRGSKDSPALFAKAGAVTQISPLNTVSQVQAAEIVLRELERPVDLTTLVDEMLKRGFIPKTNSEKLKASLATAMRLRSQFIKQGDLWSIAKS